MDNDIMNVDDGLIEWGFKSIVGGILVVGAWLWRGLVGNVRQIERDQIKFQLEIEKDFVRESSISRFHDRLDIIEEDIKTLIQAVGRK